MTRKRGLLLAILSAVLVVPGGTDLLAQVREGVWTPAAETFRRGYTSISYWTYRDDGVEIGGGRVSIEHGLPQWPPRFEDPALFDESTLGKTWRFGNNKWTSLDTQLGLGFAGRRVAPGIYYLAVARKNDAQWELVFIDPQAVRSRLIDAWALVPRPSEVPTLFSVPLDYAREDKVAEELEVELALAEQEMDQGRLTIRLGPHRLRASFTIEIVPPNFYRQPAAPEP
jgi:hypothetical protein